VSAVILQYLYSVIDEVWWGTELRWPTITTILLFFVLLFFLLLSRFLVIRYSNVFYALNDGLYSIHDCRFAGLASEMLSAQRGI